MYHIYNQACSYGSRLRRDESGLIRQVQIRWHDKKRVIF